MGAPLRFRGTFQDPARVETFEDRIVELALECEGYARIWRSASKTKPDRVIRGVLLNLAPGLDTVSLLLSPEGWLLPMHAVEEAEEGRLPGRPWVSVQTRFAPLQAHVMLVALLETLKKEFVPDLEVDDEGGYWATRDLEALRRARGDVEAPGSVPPPPRVSPEIREDPGFLAERIGRLVETVQRTLERPPEHAPVRFAEDDTPDGSDESHGTEAEWEAFYKQSQRRDARLMRALDEKSLHGELKDGDFEEAMRSEGIVDVPGLEDEEEDAGNPDGGATAWAASLPAAGDDDEENAPWRESLEDGTDGGADGDEPPLRHPLLQRASDLLLKVMKHPERTEAGWGSPLDPLIKGLMEMSGGLAQVLGVPGDPGEEDDGPFGHSLVQLKRARRGIAHARGAIAPAHDAGLIDAPLVRHIAAELDALEREILDRTSMLRDRLG
jgi:hypothetical protein